MAESVRVLWLDPDSDAVAEYVSALSSRGWIVDTARTTQEAIALAENQIYHVAIVDVVLPDGVGTDAWTRLKALQPELTGIMTTSSRSLRASIQAFKPGILTYLLKPLAIDVVRQMITTVSEYRSAALEAQRTGQQLALLRGLVAELRRATTAEQVLDVALSQVRAMLQPDWVSAYQWRAGKSTVVQRLARGGFPKLNRWTAAQAAFVERLVADAMRSQETLVANELGPAAPSGDEMQPQSVGLGALVVVPLVSRDRLYGALTAANSLASERQFAAAEIEVFLSACHATALALDSTGRAHEPDGELIGDATSGVYSAAYLEQVLASESARQTRDPHPYSLIMVDWTGIRQSCDALGPEVADVALRAWGGVARQIVRKSDVVARSRSDEFAVLLPNTDYAQAQWVAQRIETHTRASLPGAVAGAHRALKYQIVTYAPSPKGPPELSLVHGPDA